ncbi:alpha/beta hydrolase [Mycolicibacterium tokaiense]|uniref:Esterase/lipase n=1 Tax=Mycolicibacterium tokaiense TaxID=39695 RepID=A0A378TDI4_9MYCO|nr:alpha/beta hydrolase [Mycolicibacterium tokaiense]BBY86941.1 alpha/beta hydrolase [Mycolicibacterium tokaiense]STZ58554.1 esterase/lipase [Mycolicibacterium tokaiense]
MSMKLHPDITAALASQVDPPADLPAPPARGDWRTLRNLTNMAIEVDFANAAPAPDVTYERHSVLTRDDASLELRWYTKAGSSPGSALVYVHGGGMICGSLENYDPVVRQYVQWTGVPFLAVEYRLAPEHPGEIPARDVLAALKWLREHAESLGVDLHRIAIMGDSGGGGVGAGAAILARDAGVELAAQILIYPMLDDRNTTPDPHIAPLATWTYDMNYTGWHALLGDAVGTDRVSPVAAPARLTDHHGLAPAYIEVGTLDIFRDESIRYAKSLMQAGVDTELHVHPGSPHGHEWIGSTELGARCNADRIRVITEI